MGTVAAGPTDIALTDHLLDKSKILTVASCAPEEFPGKGRSVDWPTVSRCLW